MRKGSAHTFDSYNSFHKLSPVVGPADSLGTHRLASAKASNPLTYLHTQSEPGRASVSTSALRRPHAVSFKRVTER